MSRSDYALRVAGPDDLPAIVRVERAAAARFRDTCYAHLAVLPPAPPDLGASTVWVACDRGGAIVGFAEWSFADDAAYLAEVDVDPAHAGHRLGAALIDAVAADAARGGLRTIWLTTFRDLPWNAPYYRRLGFVDVPDDRLGPDLAAIRDRQTAGGLPRDRRVVMRRDAPGAST
jgi:GNAT superfamily N-acetyltransferase